MLEFQHEAAVIYGANVPNFSPSVRMFKTLHFIIFTLVLWILSYLLLNVVPRAHVIVRGWKEMYVSFYLLNHGRSHTETDLFVAE